MIDLYYWPTPNGWKISIMLEECSLPYTVKLVNIGRGEQFSPAFLKLSPNNRMPAIVDDDPPGGGEPLAIFESAAILQYLAEKTGRFLPRDVRGKYDVLQWVAWQVANLGPIAGQMNHFAAYAPEKIPYAIDRFANEMNRLLGVLERRLADRSFLAGDYSIADMATWPWIFPEYQGRKVLADFPKVARWWETVGGRPAVKKGRAVGEALRRVLVSQLSQRLRTRVDVGDVDLALHRGGVALEDVALYAPDAPGEPPVIAWKRFAVELRYLPLLWKTVQLRDIELEGPHVALDRLASGDLNLRRLLPPSEPTPAAPPTPQPSGRAWKTGIDRFVLRGGGVRFRDLTLGEGAPLDVALPDVTVRDVALQPGLYGDPGVARVYVKSEGGVLRIECRLWVLDQGFAVATHLKAFRIPLHRARLYIPGIGWSELAGELDASIDHAIAPATRNELGGMVRLRNVAVRVPDVPQAALAVERLAVRVEPIDLAAHRARVAAVDVAGAWVAAGRHG